MTKIMIKKPICSIKHFDRLLQYFKKIAIKQMLNNPHISKHHDTINSFILTETLSITDSLFDDCLVSLNKTFKHSFFKSHSGFEKKNVMFTTNKFWVTYTFETNNCKRITNNDYSDCYIAFRVFLKPDIYRKKRIAYWKVKVDWL